MEEQIEKKEESGPVTLEETLALIKKVNDVNQRVLDVYLKIVEFIESKNLYDEFNHWVNQQKVEQVEK